MAVALQMIGRVGRKGTTVVPENQLNLTNANPTATRRDLTRPGFQGIHLSRQFQMGTALTTSSTVSSSLGTAIIAPTTQLTQHFFAIDLQLHF